MYLNCKKQPRSPVTSFCMEQLIGILIADCLGHSTIWSIAMPHEVEARWWVYAEIAFFFIALIRNMQSRKGCEVINEFKNSMNPRTK